MATRRTISKASEQRFWLPERSADKDTLEHFEEFCWRLELPDEAGRFRLEDWQLVALADYFARVPETLLMFPTGSGKSTLLGALALHHGTFVREDCWVMVLGGLGKHGRNTLLAADGFIRRSPALSRIWTPMQEYGMGRIRSLIDAGLIEVSSAGRRVGERGGSAQEGSGPTQLIVEEWHRHEDGGSAANTAKSKLQKRTSGRHMARTIGVTTAGASLESPLGRMVTDVTDLEANAQVAPVREIVHLDRETKKPRKIRVGDGQHYTYARDADGDLVMHRFAVPDEVKPGEDVKAWLREVKKANPASFVTEESLRRMWKSMRREPWTFMRQAANQWVHEGTAAIEKATLKRRYREDARIPPGAEGVVVGLDTASKWDSTGIVPAWKPPGHAPIMTSGAVILRSPRTGKRRSLKDAMDVLTEMQKVWPTMRIAFDRAHGGGTTAEAIELKTGITIVDHNQGADMVQASMLIVELFDEAGIVWGPDGDSELLGDHLTSAVVKHVGTGRAFRLVRPGEQFGHQSSRQLRVEIDGATALAMACNVLVNFPAPPPPPKPFFEVIE